MGFKIDSKITKKDLESAPKVDKKELQAVASVRIEHGVSGLYPSITVRGVLANGNRRPIVDVKADKQGNLTITIGQEKFRSGHKKDKDIEYSQEIELYQFTDASPFNVNVVDPQGRKLFERSYDPDALDD